MAIHDNGKNTTNAKSRRQHNRYKFANIPSHRVTRVLIWIMQKVAERALGEIGGIIGGALAAWMLHWLCG